MIGMGVIADAVDDIFDKIEDFVSFFIIYTIVLFVLGVYYGVYFEGKPAFDYPLWLLFIAIFIYVVKEAAKSKKKK